MRKTKSGWLKIRKKCNLLYWVCIVTLMGVANTAQGQNQTNQEEIRIDDVAAALETRYDIKIFYRPEWFGKKTFSTQLTALPLHQVLDSLTLDNQLRIVHLDDNVIFTPGNVHAQSKESAPAEKESIIIGNPEDYGKYSKALVRGKIIDGSQGDPLFGAGVFDPVSHSGTTTDGEGRFELELPVGEYRLRFTYIGYEDRYHHVRVVGDGDITVELFPGTRQLDEVVISARNAQQNVTRTQMSTVTMNAKSIKELPQSFGERDIVRSITLLPGVQSQGEFGTGFNVRGGSADQNLILIENVPLFNASHLFGLISVINSDLISNVSLLKAGMSPRYGERASAVMDIKLVNTLNEESLGFEGGIGLLNSRLLLKTQLIKDRVSISLGGRSSYSDWYLKSLPDEDLLNSNAGFYDISGVSNVVLNDKNHLTIFGYYSSDTFGFSQESQFDYSNTLGSIRWDRYFNERFHMNMVAGWSNYAYQVTETPAPRPLDHFLMQSEVDYQTLKSHFTYSPHQASTWEFGVAAIKYDIMPGIQKPWGEESVMENITMESEKALEIAAFAGNDFQFTDRLAINAGLRFTQFLQLGASSVNVYENNQPFSSANIMDTLYFGNNEIVQKYSGLEPRLGVRYILGESNSVKISYNRNKQYVNLISNTAVMAPADIWKLSDYHIQPLTSDQFAMGYFHNFRENAIETSLEVYYKNLKNAIEYKSGAEIFMNEFLEQDVINTQGYNYGFEFFASKNSGTLTGWTSYTYSKSMRKTTSEFEQDQINNNQYFPSNYDRPHNLVLNLNYHMSRRWRLGTTFTYSTGRPVTLPENVYSFGGNMLVNYSDRNKYRLPDYHRLDISLTREENLKLNQKWKGSWTITLMNVYGRKNPYSVFYSKESQGFEGGKSFNLYQMYIIGRPLPTITYNLSF